MKNDDHPWYRQRGYAHFDRRPSRATVVALVTDPVRVARHGFFPFIMRPIRVSYRTLSVDKAGAKRRVWARKIRPIAYAAHMDTQIHAYYGWMIANLLEREYAEQDFAKGVLAYRALGKSNIDFALEAFAEVQALKGADVVAIDVEGFFDCLDHDRLKSAWCSLLKVKRLPPDHWAVYRSVTLDYVVLWPDLRRVLKENYRRWSGPTGEPVCTLAEFRTKVLPLKAPRYQKIWEVKGKAPPKSVSGPAGIPQGSSMSAPLANLYMLATDRILHSELNKIGASYRRYSDDILVIGPSGCMDTVLPMVEAALKDIGLGVKADKTERTRFYRTPDGSLCVDTAVGRAAMRYLGLTFDGKNVRIRDSSVSRFVMRMTRAVERGRVATKVRGEDKIKRRKVFATMSPLGPGSAYGCWVTDHKGRRWPKSAPRLGFHGYAKRVEVKADSATVRRLGRQLMGRLHHELRRKSDEIDDE